MKYCVVITCLVFAGVFFFLLATGEEVEARTITVDDDGEGDFTKIQDAINASDDGDIIRVFEGSYFEQMIMVNKSVSLIGNGSEVTRIIGNGSGVGIAITASGSNISGFNVSTWDKGMYIVSTSSNNTINNNTFYSSVMDLNLAQHNKIFNNSFISVQNSGTSGIVLYHTKFNRVGSNSFNNCGIYIQGSKVDNWITNHIETDNFVNEKQIIFLKNIKNNTIPPGAGQIILANCSNISVENQNCSKGSVGISIAFSNNISISKIIGISNKNYNCFIVNSENIQVTNNTLNASSLGIFTYKVKYSSIVNNILSENSNAGLMVYHAEEMVIQDNTCVGNKYGIGLEGNNCTIRNNVLANNFYGIKIELSNQCQIENNTISLNKEYGVHLTLNSKNNRLLGNNITGNAIGIYVSMFSSDNNVTFNDISGNKNYGIKVVNNSPHSISANNNWWGNDSGPYNPILNPGATGDNITDFVLFIPWLASDHSVIESLPDDDDDENQLTPMTIGTGILAVSLLGLAGLSYLREDIRFILLSLLSLPLYTKLDKDDILGQSNRQDIYSYIVNKPGSNLTRLHKELPIGYGTLVHHLRILEREKQIRSRKEMGRKMFFPTGTDWFRQPMVEKIQIDTEVNAVGEGAGGGIGTREVLSSIPVGFKIIEFLKGNGPSTMKEIELHLGIQQQSVSYNIRKLEEGGKVEGTGGKRNRLYSVIRDS